MRTIALLTDFGTRDPYVAAMKGVIASRCDAPIVDLTHEIAACDVWEGAFFLRDVVAYWPQGTIFVCVVDPGVGTERRILAVESEGRWLLAPDNGLLHFVLTKRRWQRSSDSPVRLSTETNEGSDGRVRPALVFAVTNNAFFLPQGSTTFHGRDRFAPAAAAIANGIALDELGPPVSDPILLDYTPGTIVRIDRFGNCITDVVPPPSPYAMVAGGQRIETVRTTYGGNGPFLIVGSTGCVEISVERGSAATLLQLRRGDRVTIVPHDH